MKNTRSKRIRSMLTGLLFVASAAPSVARAEASLQTVLVVDLAKAVLETPEGREAQKKLRRAHRERQVGVRNDEAALMRKKKRITAKQFEADLKKIQERIKKSEKQLTQMQDRLLEPILNKMRKTLRAEERAQPGLKIIELTEHPVLALPKACNVTDWVNGAYGAKQPRKLKIPKAPACSASHFVYVNFDQVIKRSKRGQDEARKLDSLQKKHQEDLDRRRRMLRDLKSKSDQDPAKWREEYRRFKKETDMIYKRHQEEIRARGRLAEDKLFKSLDRLVEQTSRKLKNAVFVELIEAKQARLTPNCDATDAFVPIFDGKASIPSVVKGCPLAQLAP